MKGPAGIEGQRQGPFVTKRVKTLKDLSLDRNLTVGAGLCPTPKLRPSPVSRIE